MSHTAQAIERRAGVLYICHQLRQPSIPHDQLVAFIDELEDLCLQACNVADAAFDVIETHRQLSRRPWWHLMFSRKPW